MVDTILWLISAFVLILLVSPFVSLVWFIYCVFKFKFEKDLQEKQKRKRLLKISTIITLVLIITAFVTFAILLTQAVKHM